METPSFYAFQSYYKARNVYAPERYIFKISTSIYIGLIDDGHSQEGFLNLKVSTKVNKIDRMGTLAFSASKSYYWRQDDYAQEQYFRHVELNVHRI
jgi:hypothetical protein